MHRGRILRLEDAEAHQWPTGHHYFHARTPRPYVCMPRPCPYMPSPPEASIMYVLMDATNPIKLRMMEIGMSAFSHHFSTVFMLGKSLSAKIAGSV